jgi:hypothetical protein
MQREKGNYVILENLGLFVQNGWEWEVKIKTYEGYFAKSQELTFKLQIEMKLPKGCKCSVDFK